MVCSCQPPPIAAPLGEEPGRFPLLAGVHVVPLLVPLSPLRPRGICCSASGLPHSAAGWVEGTSTAAAAAAHDDWGGAPSAAAAGGPVALVPSFTNILASGMSPALIMHPPEMYRGALPHVDRSPQEFDLN